MTLTINWPDDSMSVRRCHSLALSAEILRKAAVRDKHQIIVELCRGQTVLDVGCVGQAFGTDSPDWLYGKLKQSCHVVHGTDIDREAVAGLQARGFPVYLHQDLLSLGTQYDIVLMADVIEHVGNPQQLIESYVPLLRPGGKIVLSTPNALRIKEALGILLAGNYGVHEEHVMWFCPRTLAALGSRCGLQCDQFYWLKEHRMLGKAAPFKARLVRGVCDALAALSHLYSPNFLLVLAK